MCARYMVDEVNMCGSAMCIRVEVSLWGSLELDSNFEHVINHIYNVYGWQSPNLIAVVVAYTNGLYTRTAGNCFPLTSGIICECSGSYL